VTLFLTALGLALMIEGLLYAAFPDQMKGLLAKLLDMPSTTLRLGALVCAGLGLAIVAIAVSVVSL